MPKKKAKLKSEKKPARKSKAGKKHSKGKSKPRKKRDSVLSSMEKDLRKSSRSVMLEEEMKPQRSHLVEVKQHDKDLNYFYRKMVLRCRKCERDFNHEAKLKPIEVELSCPSCNESHLLTFHPKSKFYIVRSKSLDVVDTLE